MKRLYQKEWQGFQFAGFAKLSTKQLADAEFYNAFYRELFKHYGGYDELDAAWRRNKGELANWIAARLTPGSRVLSVGCGLGYMEHCLQRSRKDVDLHVQDYASDALTWLRQVIPASHIHLGGGETLQTEEGQYDLIYLSAVDYAVDDNALNTILADMKNKLRAGGVCLIISASFQDQAAPLIKKIKVFGKELIECTLEYFGFFHRGQLWGWKRTQLEYRNLMHKAGYIEVNDGFIETPNQRTYFIEGRTTNL